MVLASVTLLPAFLGLAGHADRPLAGGGRTRPGARLDGAGATTCPRHARGVRGRRDGAPAGAGRAGARPAAGNPGRGQPAPPRAPSAAPTTSSPTASAPASTARWSSPSRTPARPARVRAAVAADRGHRLRRAARDARRRWRRWSPTPRRRRRTTRPPPRSSASRRALTGRARTSAATRRPGPTSATGSRSGCRYFLAAVVLLSFLLLTVVFRSLVVPLKAAVLNLLGVGAAYGVVVVGLPVGLGRPTSSASSPPCRSSRSSRSSCSRSCSGSRWTTRCSCSRACASTTCARATTTPR